MVNVRQSADTLKLTAPTAVREELVTVLKLDLERSAMELKPQELVPE